MNSHINRRHFIHRPVVAIGLILAYAACWADALPMGYTAVRIGLVEGVTGGPYDLNELGQVVGETNSGQAFVTGDNGTALRLLNLPAGATSMQARDINDSGQVAGWAVYANADDRRAFFADAGSSSVRILGTLSPPGAFPRSSGTGINSSGQVVGWSSFGDSTRAFVSGPNGGALASLGLPAGGAYSVGQAINDLGVVVGTFNSSATGTPHAFITDPGGTNPRDIGTLGGLNSNAYAVNSAGRVAGSSSNIAGQSHAYVTAPGGVGMVDLGTLNGGSSVIYDLNDRDQGVGYSFAAGSFRAIVVDALAGRMVDLNTLVTMPAGEALGIAFGLNNVGQIVGVSSAGRMWLLSPMAASVPEAPIGALFATGLLSVGLLLRRRARL